LSFEDVLVQVFQPYFYYSIIVLTVSFVCIKIAVKCCPFLGSKSKSLLYLIPIVAPLFVMLSFPPKIAIPAVSYSLIGSFSVPLHHGAMLFNPFHSVQPSLPPTMVTLVALSTSQILSLTGIICLAGLAFGGIYAVTTLVMGDWIASRLLNVINLDSDEYGWLQTEIAKIAKKLSISTPQVALIEDLRPNAFTMGNGRKTKLVFTIGLLNILDKEEILAVASHELAHVKNHDFFFKTISNALTAVSFFNPLAYLAFFNSQREREMLADENGAKLLQKPDSLANALTKITSALKDLPNESRLIRITSNLLVTSPIIHRPQILSGHPKINLRLKNINQLTAAKPKRLKPSRLIVAIMLTSLIIVAGVATTYALVNVQSGYVTPKVVLSGASYVKGLSNDLNGSHIILVDSNWTSSSMLEQIYSLQNSNPKIIPPSNQASQNALPTFNQNQAAHMTPQMPLFSSQPNLTNQIAIIYALTNGNGTTLFIKI